jgi:hypothetical protein
MTRDIKDLSEWGAYARTMARIEIVIETVREEVEKRRSSTALRESIALHSLRTSIILIKSVRPARVNICPGTGPFFLFFFSLFFFRKIAPRL